jgi:hypothetical protein
VWHSVAATANWCHRCTTLARSQAPRSCVALREAELHGAPSRCCLSHAVRGMLDAGDNPKVPKVLGFRTRPLRV